MQRSGYRRGAKVLSKGQNISLALLGTVVKFPSS